MPRVLRIILALSFCWVALPIASYITAEDSQWGLPLVLGVVMTICLLALCFALRKEPAIVLVWTPLFCLSAFAAYEVSFAMIGEMSAPGGGEPAPLEGLAILIGFVAWAVSLLLLFASLVAIPRKIDWAMLLLSLLNCAAIAFTIDRSEDLRERQMITVRVLDKNDHPIQGAQVRYKVYGYGPRGTRPAWAAITGGPIPTAIDGTALLRSRKIRYEVDFDVSKDGYLPVFGNLGMEFDKYAQPRFLRLRAGEHGKPIGGYLPGKEPIVITLYLPDIADGPQKLRFKRSGIRIGPTGDTYRYFDFASGYFRKTPDADLEFEFVGGSPEPTRHRDQKLQITALHGGGIVEVPPPLSQDHPHLTYGQMAFQAPSSGYQETWVQGDRESSVDLYFRSADGSRYARMWIEPMSDGHGAGSMMFVVWINDRGSRDLMDDPRTEN